MTRFPGRAAGGGYGEGLTFGDVSAPWRLVIGDRIGPAECPYMRRWFVQTPFGSVRIHQFLRSDDDRAFHDHPWSFVTLILRGGYRDLTACPTCEGGRLRHVGYVSHPVPCEDCGDAGYVVEEMRPGMVRFRSALHQHRVEVDDGASALTLVVSGRKTRTWGFWQGRKFTAWREFIGLNGSPACSDGPATHQGGGRRVKVR